MRNGGQPARPIRTVADVRAVLDSPKASFSEYLDCVRVCAKESAWDIYQEASRRACKAATSGSRVQIPGLVEAARHLVKAIMRKATDLNDLGLKATEAMASVKAIELSISDRENLGEGFTDFRTHITEELSQLRVLSADPSVDGLLRFCARLRKWVERPDLAVVAGERAKTLEPNNLAVLTSLGAAYADLGEYQSARQHLGTVLRADPDEKRAVTCLSRVEYETGNFNESHRLAQRAFKLEPDRFSAHRLLSSALATDDQDALREAKEWISSLSESHSDFGEDGYLAYLSANILYQADRLEEALAALRVVVDVADTSSAIRTKARRLIKKIRSDLQRRQGRLDLVDSDAAGVERGFEEVPGLDRYLRAAKWDDSNLMED